MDLNAGRLCWVRKPHTADALVNGNGGRLIYLVTERCRTRHSNRLRVRCETYFERLMLDSNRRLTPGYTPFAGRCQSESRCVSNFGIQTTLVHRSYLAEAMIYLQANGINYLVAKLNTPRCAE